MCRCAFSVSLPRGKRRVVLCPTCPSLNVFSRLLTGSLQGGDTIVSHMLTLTEQSHALIHSKLSKEGLSGSVLEFSHYLPSVTFQRTRYFFLFDPVYLPLPPSLRSNPT